jgi:hypothetical protein
MSLIHTCELYGVNPFDYLTELKRHVEELKRSPSEWMPWNYREALARLARAAYVYSYHQFPLPSQFLVETLAFVPADHEPAQ